MGLTKEEEAFVRETADTFCERLGANYWFTVTFKPRHRGLDHAVVAELAKRGLIAKAVGNSGRKVEMACWQTPQKPQGTT